VHAGIYLATARGFDDAEGVQLEVRAPSASTDALRLLQGGRADMAILDIHDLGLARQEGADLVGVMAVVQRPLAALLAQPEIKRPRDLEARRVGVSGLPSDVAVLRSVVAGDGGDPERVRTTTIGFEAVRALLGGGVAGATAFWNVEGVALREQRPGMNEFRVDDYGAPAYPELVLCVTRRALDERRPVIEATIRALQRGYVQAQNDPESAVTALVEAESGLDREAAQAQLDAVAPAFTAGARGYGELQADVLRAWADWDVEFGILEERPDVRRAFDTSLVGPAPAD
jgi:ABC-type nitrate/sulfonate/bicarbonate transport system substrate-binding protein